MAKLLWVYTMEYYSFVRKSKVDLYGLRYSYEEVLGDYSPWVSSVSVIFFFSTGTDFFHSRIYFPGCLYREQPWRTHLVFPSGAKGSLFTA